MQSAAYVRDAQFTTLRLQFAGESFCPPQHAYQSYELPKIEEGWWILSESNEIHEKKYMALTAALINSWHGRSSGIKFD